MVFSTTRFDGITLEPARVIVKTNGQVFIDNVNGGVAVNDSYIMNGISFYKSFNDGEVKRAKPTNPILSKA